MARCYVRNGVWGWSPDRQIAALGECWDAGSSYRDTLPAERARAPGRIRPEWLVERERMLRPSGRVRDEIHVAIMTALAVDEADLLRVLALAAGRNATIHVVSSGLVIPPGCGMQSASDVIEVWLKDKLDGGIVGWKTSGVHAAAERKRAETMRKLKVGRPLWRSTKPDRMTTEQVAEAAELSVKTLYNELGRRPRIKTKGQTDAE